MGKGLKAGLAISLGLLAVSFFVNIYLVNQIKILKDIDLREIDFETHIQHHGNEMPLIDEDGQIYWSWLSVIQVTETIVNMGTDDSHDTKLTVLMYDNSSQLLKSEEIELGTIDGRSYLPLTTNIRCAVTAYNESWVHSIRTVLSHS